MLSVYAGNLHAQNMNRYFSGEQQSHFLLSSHVERLRDYGRLDEGRSVCSQYSRVEAPLAVVV